MPIRKTRLFELGYISERSGHSRGSTVDLTLIPLPAPSQATYEPERADGWGCAVN
jgi:D-alanyl-D-alanine dipeptidase